jgi:hypothetical protein
MSIARLYFRGAVVNRPPDPGPFRGNPNVTITAVDTSGGIATSRDDFAMAGEVPAFIQVSISNFTATGTSYPFRDLEAKWDFGDPSGTEQITNPVTGLTVNPNSDQVGPEALYVYRTAGTYTITCTLRWWNGSGYSTTTKTKDFTVSAFSGTNEFWFDSNAPGGGDGSLANPFNDHATLKTKSNLGGANLHLKYGSTFTSASGSSNHIVGQDHARIDAYGNPADGKPIIVGVDVANGTLWFQTQFNDQNDSVYSNIEFRVSGTTTHPIRFTDQPSYTFQCTNIYFDGCVFNFCQVDTTHNVEGQGYDAFSGHGFYKCVSLQTVGDIGIANVWMLGTATRWLALLGCSVSCTSPKVWNDLLDHWIYPGIEFHGMYKWCLFGQGNTMFGINGNQHGTNNEHRKWHLISENNFNGTAGGIEFSVSQPGIENSSFDDTVVEGNLFYNHTTDNCISVVYCFGLTVRDNYVSHGVNSFVGIATARDDEIAFDVYRNKVYGLSLTVGTSNNTQRIQITDNEVWNTGSAALCMRINSADAAWTGQGSIIDRNEYYVPSDSNGTYNSHNGGSTVLSFANWQAAGFDLNGSELVSAPAWPDPANGDFGQ